MSKLLANALIPTGQDPYDTAIRLHALEKKEPWVLNAFLGALSLDRMRYSEKDLLTFITKLSQCGKNQAIDLLKTNPKNLHGLLRMLNTVGNRVAQGVNKPVV
jgi:hypothetical protein